MTARSTTKEEFVDQFKCIKQAAEAALQNPLYSFDNISTQQYAELSALGITQQQRLPLGPNMPDAHQIVEHCFAGFKPWFIQRVFMEESPAAGSAQLQAVLKREWANFGQHCDRQGTLKKNADSLPITLEAISMPKVAYLSQVDNRVRVGTNGGWVTNPLS
jgi:hypothetical protein